MKNLSKDHLEKVELTIRQLVDKLYGPQMDEDFLPIYDGIVDVDKYVSSKYKILWVLKEARDETVNGEPAGGGWQLTKDVIGKKDFYEKIGNSPTWHSMIYVTYGILNGFKRWNQMDYIRDDKEEMANSLKQIAFINVNKMPALAYSDDNVIREKYNETKDLILRQIKDYSPDIIIGGNTLSFMAEDLGIAKGLADNKGLFAVKDGALFINAYHPSQRTMLREDYVDEIINLSEAWSKEALRP